MAPLLWSDRYYSGCNAAGENPIPIWSTSCVSGTKSPQHLVEISAWFHPLASAFVKSNKAGASVVGVRKPKSPSGAIMTSRSAWPLWIASSKKPPPADGLLTQAPALAQPQLHQPRPVPSPHRRGQSLAPPLYLIPMPDHEPKHCPRCGGGFECRLGSIHRCQCVDVILSDAAREAIGLEYDECLCRDCLLAIAAAERIDDERLASAGHLPL